MYPEQTKMMAIFADKRVRRGLIALGILLVLWLMIPVFLNALFFRVSKTDPSMRHMAAANAYIDIHFSRDIVAKSLSLKYSEPFVRKTVIGEDKVRLEIQTEGLKVDHEYTIIVRVDSSGGKQILDKQLRFTAKDVPVNKLGKAQQEALIKRQGEHPYAPEYISYQNFDPLLTRGISAEQLQSVKESLFNYSNTVKKQFWTMTLDPSSVVFQRHNPESADLNDHLSFRLTLGSDTFTVNTTLDPVDNTAILQLVDASGTLVYDSFSGHD